CVSSRRADIRHLHSCPTRRSSDLTVTAPEGTLVHAVPPASLGGRVVSGLRVMDVTFGALAQAVPEHVPAAGAGQGMLPMVSTPAFAEKGQRVNLLQPLVGGSGGRPTLDGYDGMDYTLGFLKNTPDRKSTRLNS